MGAAPENIARPQAEKRRDLKLASGDNLASMLEPEAARELFLASCTLVIVVSEATTKMMLMMTMTMTMTKSNTTTRTTTTKTRTTMTATTTMRMRTTRVVIMMKGQR